MLQLFHTTLLLTLRLVSRLYFQAIKVRLWPKQKTSKNSKDESPQTQKPAKALASAATRAIPQLTEAERRKQSPFERIIYDMTHNEKIVNDLMLGRRVGFYELRGEIGQGNFSTVRLGIHALTKGKKTKQNISYLCHLTSISFLLPGETHFCFTVLTSQL